MSAYVLLLALAETPGRSFALAIIVGAISVPGMVAGALFLQRGRLRAGALVISAALSSALGVVIVSMGLNAGRMHLRWMVLPLVIAVFLADSCGVWIGMAFVPAVALTAAARDAGYLGGTGPHPVPSVWDSVASVSLLFLLLAILLQRLGSELGRMLVRSLRRKALLKQTCADLRRAHAGLQKEMEQRKQTEAALIRAQRLEALGVFSAGIAHDFNNLLTVVLANLGYIESKLPPEGPARECAADIRTASNRASALVRELLTFARREVTEPRPVRLDAVVRDFAPILRRSIGKHVRLELPSAEAPWLVRVDPAKFEQVLLNLALNARDAMPNGGTITIHTTNEHVGAPACADHGIEPGEYVQVLITDTGNGMDQATLDRAFEPFFTTKQSSGGTGLGLASCYGIVTQAGGGIGVSSRSGEGTSVRIYLPRTVECPQEEQMIPGGRLAS